jgi:signal transduction histidine kinase/ActR/RegA family two-component response regulator
VGRGFPTLDAWAAASWGLSSGRATLEQIHGAGEGPTGRPLELALRTKQGEIRRWLLYSAELGNMNHGRRAWMVSALDLTERKAAEDERNRALAQAEAANRSKDQFLATLSHELRTPLNVILGWIFLMKQESVKPEVQKEGVAVIERNARAQSNLIADLLDISRIVAGKLRLEPRQLNFLSCLESALDNIRPSANEKGVRVISRVDSSVWSGIMMIGDPVRLEQVLLNLLVNAIKFTPANGTVEISVEVVDSLMRLKVADTGIGIEPEFLPCLFDWFSQADKSLRKNHGLGLGLTICRHIIELHGGNIFAMSEGPGKGASFTIELPLASGRLVNSPDKSLRPDSQEEAIKTLEDVTIVAVDDNADARGFIDQVLKQHGATVISEETGPKAIQAVLQYHPDVVLCDLMMPEMDGYALLRQIRTLDDEVTKNVPVVAMTALAGAENRLKTQQAGFQAHLDKPIDPPLLIQTIQALIKVETIGKRF